MTRSTHRRRPIHGVFALAFRLAFPLSLLAVSPLVPQRLALAKEVESSVPTTNPAAATFKSQYERPKAIPYPPDNPPSEAKELLGRTLFFDPRLSGSSFISCASCHNPALSWGDGMAKGIGHGMKQLPRRTPTILNVAWGEIFFWDGRAESLEEQALGPIQSPGEMNMPLDKMIATVKGIPEYRALFEKAFPNEPVSERTIAKALATFERTVVSGQSPFDRWVAGDENALSDEAKRGFVVFNTKGRCSSCHSGWRFTDDSFHDIGIPGDDIGRGKILPKVAGAAYTFKTPTLRNVDRRRPLMHDGSEATLIDAIELYDMGGRVKRPTLSPDVRPLGLSPREKQDLASFLRSLTSKDERQVVIPTLPM